MKILLVDPPFQRFIGFYRFYFPLGLTYLASMLKQANHEVLIYDGEHDVNCISPSMKDAASNHHLYVEALQDDTNPVWSEYIQLLHDFQPQMVGFSVLTAKLSSVIKMIRMTKNHDSNIIVVAGGEHVTIRPHDVLKERADYVVCGEGELSIIRLVQALSEGDCPSKIVSSPLIEEIDAIPLPAIDSLQNITSYRSVDLGLMVSARGCPFACTFCGLCVMWGRRVRYHSVGRVVQEITLRMKKYGTRYFSFRNGTFTIDRKRVVDFCQRLLNDRLSIGWECLTRVDMIDGDLLQIMKKAGCNTIRIGIESGSEEVLRYMNKGISLSQVRVAADILNRSGLFWSAYFMLGVPIETENTMRATVNLIKEIDPPFVTLAKFTPLPGTSMYREVIDSGLLNENNTDWTWAANQSLEQAFVKGMDSTKFLGLLSDIAQFVEEHNAKHALLHSDSRLKC